jgi:c-di-GMP-binding flagellar brake protein YcgR
MTALTPDTPKHADTPLDPGSYSQYLLHARSEILFVLRSLVSAADRITVHFHEGRDFFLSTLLTVDNAGIVLDCGGNAEINRLAQEADRLYCVTNHEKVLVQFLLRELQSCLFEGKPAFRAPLPESVLRLQRREYYRLTAPVAHPLKCRIPMPVTHDAHLTVEASVLDISGGGLAVIKPPSGMTLAPGMEFANCRVELPEIGVLVATLQIKSLFEVTLRTGAQVTRAGCQFIDLPGPMLTLVQRYIIKVERERKARESGIG